MTEERQEEKPVPEPTLLDLFQGFFHRQDKLLGYMAETQRQTLTLLRAIAGVPVLPVPTLEAPAVTVEVTGITEDALEQLLKTPLAVMAWPLGRVKKKGTLTTTTSYQTLCSITVTKGKTFQLANISMSADQDVICKLVWQDKDLTPVYYVMAELPFDKWFPPRYHTDEGKSLLGDGSAKLELKVAYPSGGSASSYCAGEIVGDEV